MRRASVGGRVAQKFSHPFVEQRDGVTWAFQHNGSLLNDLGDSGKIDSQLLFELLLDRLDGPDHDSVVNATATVREVAIQKHGGLSRLQFKLSDRQPPHAHRELQTNRPLLTVPP